MFYYCLMSELVFTHITLCLQLYHDIHVSCHNEFISLMRYNNTAKTKCSAFIGDC